VDQSISQAFPERDRSTGIGDGAVMHTAMKHAALKERKKASQN